MDPLGDLEMEMQDMACSQRLATSPAAGWRCVHAGDDQVGAACKLDPALPSAVRQSASPCLCIQRWSQFVNEK
jgi:hypothetical protein